jgi:2-oxoglutarate dehydrogenase E2 component (dihydrolipoamide succinyltransferase)
MSEKILVPVLGESITEATVAKWLKKKGESVDADEPIIELETDKVNLEVPSPITGVITEINCNNGDTVAVGAVLGTVTDGTKETEKIEKKEKKSSEQNQSNNIINLEQEKNQEPRFFQDKNNFGEKPLILLT